MKRWWMSLGLAGWLGCATLVPAQSFLPSPVGAARIIDPTPTAPSTVNDKYPPLVDGPITPKIAPPGPPDSLSLPVGHTSAFMADSFGQDQGVFVHLGTIALFRQTLGGSWPAFQDLTGSPANNPLALQPNRVGPPLQGFNDISTPLRWGMRGSLGYFWAGQTLEATFWGIFQGQDTLTTNSPNGIYSFFFNPPAGFDQHIWLEASKLTTQFSWSLFNSELNYRYASASVLEMEIILGVRWVSLRERISVATSEFQPALPVNTATYSVETRNNLVGPQIGWEWVRNLKIVTVGFTGKAAVAANFDSIQTSLVRGDAYRGFDFHRSSLPLAGIFEATAFVDLIMTERMHVRGGYTALWLTGVSKAVDQVDFNLGNPIGHTNDNGSEFFHGPSVELQFVF